MMIQTLLERRLVMQPKEDEEGEYYEFSGVGTMVPLIRGIVPHNLASPSIPSWNQIHDWLTAMQQLRNSSGFAA